MFGTLDRVVWLLDPFGIPLTKSSMRRFALMPSSHDQGSLNLKDLHNSSNVDLSNSVFLPIGLRAQEPRHLPRTCRLLTSLNNRREIN